MSKKPVQPVNESKPESKPSEPQPTPPAQPPKSEPVPKPTPASALRLAQAFLEHLLSKNLLADKSIRQAARKTLEEVKSVQVQ